MLAPSLGDLLRAHGRGAFVEQAERQRFEPALVARIGGAARIEGHGHVSRRHRVALRVIEAHSVCERHVLDIGEVQFRRARDRRLGPDLGDGDLLFGNGVFG